VQLELTQIKTDGGTQPRAALDQFVIDDYAQAMKAGLEFPPVVVFYDGEHYWLADGFHRTKATEQAELTLIEAEVRQGTRREAVLYSVGANAAHGFRRTNADKRRAVETLLTDSEWSQWSDSEIARKCAVSVMSVGRIRSELISNNVIDTAPRLATRGGTTYSINTVNIGKPASPLVVNPAPVEEARLLLRDTHIAEKPEQLRQLAAVAPQLQVRVAEKLAQQTGVGSVATAKKLVLMEEAHQQLTESQSQDKPDPWIITEEQAVVPCAALITDPPYGVLDGIDWEPTDLEAFTREWATRWRECQADTILIFWSQLYLWEGKRWFDASLSGYQFEQLLIWHYPNGVKPKGPDGFKETYDPIFFYRRVGTKREIQIPITDWNQGLNRFDCHVAAVPQSNYNGDNFKQHTSQKPLSALRWLVAATTTPGELVADPFCGSGTTGIAASQLGRQFHGIVNRPEDLALSQERLALYGDAPAFEAI